MWFEPKVDGDRCTKCKGTGRILEIAVGLGNQKLVPAYVEITCPKCKGDGVVSSQDDIDWRNVKSQGKTGEKQKPVVEIIVENEFAIPDTFFFKKWLNNP